MTDLANPININLMLCVRSEGTCEMSASELDLKDRMLIAAAPVIFDIKTWTPNRITAVREHPCGTASLTVDVQTKDVTSPACLMLICHFAAKNLPASGL